MTAIHGSRSQFARGASFIAVLLVLSAFGPASAQNPPAREDCRRTAKDEREMTACFAKLTREQATAMATAIQKLKRRYSEPSEKSFAPTIDKSQRAWAAWRDAECALKTWESRDGSGYANIRAGCIHNENAARMRMLEEMLDNP